MFKSFFLRPLDFVRSNIEKFDSESAIAKYLGKEDKPDSIDVLKHQESLQELLSPFMMQPARWCSSPSHSLVALQAAAINLVLPSFSGKLFAVNGPPGTGTILFALIANIYVDRASYLATLEDPKDGFQNKKSSLHTPNFDYHVNSLKPELQTYGMVVASSNNNAVENISKEISLYSKIDKLYHKDLSYFKQLLLEEEKEKDWGIFAAVLGNHGNKKRFSNKFWKYKDEEENDDKNDEKHTMLQYLNLLVNNKCKDKVPAHFKPEYCNSIDEINNEWKEACADFNNLYSEIHEVYENIASVIELNKKKRELIKEEDLGAIYAEKKEEPNELELELDYKSSKILEIDCKIKLLNLVFFEKIHAFFKTAKYNSC
ncbi:superfamily I DNA/RNA helicase [Rickettsia amblyommatis str. GAT-30V]|uniref:Superfamily I DNA/RNA helicase n=1 Tax=Rickettsia amblyommatis (strain GAT-30V) TaxID=1105111 RepID=H8K2W5_RICAG|nr:hypothetical protein [Rickettsia amblyommatis]AFC70233.1 superfamily I DNA/RNA helicase [Rickettsia amblyommatis str. GAT-30V]